MLKLKPNFPEHIFLLIGSIGVLLVTLTAGLTPKGNYAKNWVSTVPSLVGIHIGQHGFLYGEAPKLSPIKDNDFELTISIDADVHEQAHDEKSIFPFGALLYLGDGCEENPLIVGQWLNKLVVMKGCDVANLVNRPQLSTEINPDIEQPINISILFGTEKSELRVNGEIVSVAKGPIITQTQFSSYQKMLAGNSPDGFHGWTGTLNSLKIVQSFQNEEPSTRTETHSDFQFNGRNISEKLINHSTSNQDDLNIPKIGWFPQKPVLSRLSIDSLLEKNKLDLLINTIGFVPWGICATSLLFVFLGFSRIRLILATVAIGMLTSLAIELSQIFIAGRQSHLHDLVLNVSGAFFGALIFLFSIFLYRLINGAKVPTESTAKSRSEI